MPSLYIVLDAQIPGADIYVNGNSLSKSSDELERIATRLGIRPLMSFFSISNEELSSVVGEDVELGDPAQERWFAPEEGLCTVNALLGGLAASKLGNDDRIAKELQEFIRVLELARANSRRWHLAVDY